MSSKTPLETIDTWGVLPICVKLSESFEEVVVRNPELRMEQTASGEVIFMSPTGGESGYRNAKVNAQLDRWAESYGGRVFDSSTLFVLPNGAKRSPDAAWISTERWNALTRDERKGFPPLCPDFVIELRSETDRLIDLQEKMQEFVANGIRLGWLIDPLLKKVHVYRPGFEVEVHAEPETISAGDAMPGLVVDCSKLWVDA